MPFAVPSSFATGTTHGTPWNYDTQVPLIFWGSAFKPGFYATPCQPTDLAATLAARLGLTQPSGAQGTPLASSLK
jgi:arylsulfatase A-like enzyme